MSERIKAARGKNDTVKTRSGLKRKYQPETSDFRSNGHGDGKTSFNDMCDYEIDMILCALPLEDLINLSDASYRLRGIATSIFARKHAHRLLSIEAFNSCRNKGDNLLDQEAIVRIGDAKICCKLLRNFGCAIKHIRIRDRGYTLILANVENLIKYVAKHCRSLDTLEVYAHRFFISNKSLTKAQEFSFHGALESILNVRSLTLGSMPSIMAKHYGKLERIDLKLEVQEDVKTFLSFVCLNREIKYLRLGLCCKCSPEQTHSIYSSIAEKLTQLRTFKVYDPNMRDMTSPYLFKTVESYSNFFEDPRYTFEFHDLKKLALRAFSGQNFMNFVLRNKKLQILKLNSLDLHETLLSGGVIENLLKELPQLEQIVVPSLDENANRTLTNLLGRQWEQFERKKTVEFDEFSRYSLHRFRKIESTT